MAETLEWSLPVPSVQEVVRQDPDAVPERFVRDIIVSNPGYAPPLSVPLLNMSKLLSADEAELEKLHYTCRDWGIFQLINHGLSKECLRKMRKSAEEFFAMPLEDKKQCGQEAGSLEGYGQAFVASEEQKLDWSDMVFVKALPVRNRNPRPWKRLPEELRDSVDNYSQSVRDLAACLVKQMVKLLGAEASEFWEKSLKGGIYEMRLNYCPPCFDPDRVLGISPHADISFITVLLDCGNQPALQALKDGHWVFIQPVKDAVVVNLGQIMQVVSNGIYKAPEHRVMVNRQEERLSIVTFCYPSSSAAIGPAQELVGPESPAIYKNLSLDDYFHCFFNRKLDDPFIGTLKL